MKAALQSAVISGENVAGAERVLTPAALDFITRLHHEFDARRRELLQLREVRQREIRAGRFPIFLAETAPVRNSEWTVATAPPDSSVDGEVDLGPQLQVLATPRVQVSVPATPVRLPTSTATELVAIAREALTNADKHAGPRSGRA